LGEEVPPGTVAADLQRHPADSTWEEPLVFLLELLAGATPRAKQKIREAVFSPDCFAVTGRHRDWPQTAVLLARLTPDPHVNWDLDTQASAADRCLTVAAGYHQTDDPTDLYYAAPIITDANPSPRGSMAPAYEASRCSLFLQERDRASAAWACSSGCAKCNHGATMVVIANQSPKRAQSLDLNQRIHARLGDE
jgi:hypothetical protein